MKHEPKNVEFSVAGATDTPSLPAAVDRACGCRKLMPPGDIRG
jgi:hypothetical protein